MASAVRGRWASQQQRRGQRALVRQLRYQELKSRAAQGREADIVASMLRESSRVRGILDAFGPSDDTSRVVEVGSGAHGLVFYFGTARGVGVDPLAVHYASLFPKWQRRVPTVAAVGSALPFPDRAFDVVLCDNVVDHAENPAGIVRELARILSPGGLLYFTVNVHHGVYAVAAWLHATWNAAGLHLEIGPFADHTVHLTPAGARRLFRELPLKVLDEQCDAAEAKELARQVPPRHVGDRLKRIFYKNALYAVVAQRS